MSRIRLVTNPAGALLSMMLIFAGSARAANSPSISSAYTDISVFDWEHGCEVLRKTKDKESGYLTSAIWRCRGYRNAPLFVRYEDNPTSEGRGYDIDAGAMDTGPVLSAKPEAQPETVEWRIARQRPFAVIYRLTLLLDAYPKPNPSTLIVETVGTARKPGCRIAEIDALEPNANTAARRAADAVLSGKAHCIKFDG